MKPLQSPSSLFLSIHSNLHSAGYLQIPFQKGTYFKSPVMGRFNLFLTGMWCHCKVQLCSAFSQLFSSWKPEGERDVRTPAKLLRELDESILEFCTSRTKQIALSLVCFGLLWLLFFLKKSENTTNICLGIDQWTFNYCNYISTGWRHDLWRHFYLEKHLSKYLLSFLER